MQHQENENITSVRLEQYFLILYRSKWSVFFILLLALMTAFIKNDISQPTYQATAQLWVKQQEKGLPSSGFEDMFMTGIFGRAAELETLSEIIRSPATLEKVVDGLALLENPLPKHRGKFLTWFSDRLGVGILSAIPEMSATSYREFRNKWLALELPYRIAQLEDLVGSLGENTPVSQYNKIRAVSKRLGQLSRLDFDRERANEIRLATADLKRSIEAVRKQRPKDYESLQKAIGSLAELSKTFEVNDTEQEFLGTLAVHTFQQYLNLESTFGLESREETQKAIQKEGLRPVYDARYDEDDLVSPPRFADFQDYYMDPIYNYGDYRRLIQRRIQEDEIRDAYSRFLQENIDHPDRSLWSFDEFRQYYRRVQHEKLVKELRENLSVQPLRDTDVIRITVKAATQERAVSIVNRLAAVFEKLMVDDSRSRMQKTKRFATEKKQIIQKQLSSAANELSRYQTAHDTISLTAEAEATITSLNQLRLLLTKAKMKSRSADSRVKQLTAQLQEEDPTILASETLTANPALVELRLKLKDAYVELARLKARYPDGQNEEIARQEVVIAAREQALLDEAENQVTQTRSPNPLVTSLMDQLIRAHSEMLAAQAEIATLGEQIGYYEGLLAKMPDMEKELARLKREVMLYQSLSETLAQAEQEAMMLSEAEPGNITTFQPAAFSQDPLPISPRKMMNLMLGGLIGLSLGIGLAFLREYLDNTYGTVEEAQRDLELSSKRMNAALEPTFLTMVPAIESMEGDRSYIVAVREPKSAAAEAFRIIRTKLQFMGAQTPVRCILVTSSTPGEGKSTISSNLAVALAQQMGKRVLLIDADLRKSVQHRIFRTAANNPHVRTNRNEIEATVGTELVPSEADEDTDGQLALEHDRKPGLTDLLIRWRLMFSNEPEDSPVRRWLEARQHNADVRIPDGSNGSKVLEGADEEIARQQMQELLQGIVRQVYIPKSNEQTVVDQQLPDMDLSLIPSGTNPPNPSELLGSESMEQLLEFLRTEYDYIVIDSPPVRAAADPIILSSLVDTVIYTFDIVKTKRFDIRTALEELLEANPRNIGTLCNLTEVQHAGYYGYGGRYGYNKYGYYYGRYRYSNYYQYYYSDSNDDQETET